MRPCAGAYAERLRTMTCHTRKYIEAERPEGAWLWLGTHFHVLAAASPSLRAPLRKLAIVRARFRGVQKRHTSRVKIFRGGIILAIYTTLAHPCNTLRARAQTSAPLYG